jgi:hypothetical protein
MKQLNKHKRDQGHGKGEPINLKPKKTIEKPKTKQTNVAKFHKDKKQSAMKL